MSAVNTTDDIISNVPRDPAAYTPSLHFAQRFKDSERKLSGEVVRECIVNGKAEYQASTGNVLFNACVCGRQYRLVVDPDTREVCSGILLEDNVSW